MNSLHWYLLRRLVLLLFVTVAVLTILFVMFKLLPGNPLSVFIDSNFSEEMIRRQKQLWGLDAPLWLQYVRYMWNMLTFNFGTSFFQMTPVRDIVVEKLLHTAAMIVPAVVLSVVLGALLGSWLGWRRGSRREGAVVISLLALRSVPSFFVGILVLMVFSYQLGWLPPGGMVSLGGPATLLGHRHFGRLLAASGAAVSRARQPRDHRPGPFAARIMLEVKGSDFIDILRAKGLPERQIVTHAARNALLPLVTYVAVMTGLLFQGQVLLEIIFAWPGIGRELVVGAQRPRLSGGAGRALSSWRWSRWRSISSPISSMARSIRGSPMS